MRILFGCGFFFPDSFGGTEIYLAQIALQLVESHHDVAIVSLKSTLAPENHQWNGIPVFRIGTTDSSKPAVENWENPHNLSAFEEILDEQKPHIFHLHTLTPGLHAAHLAVARKRGICTAFSGHVPGVLCGRGDLIYMGKRPCDGKLDFRRCTHCILDRRGLPALPRIALMLTYRALKNTPAGLRLPASLSIVDLKVSALQGINTHCHAVISVSRWLSEMFVLNGIDAGKIVLIPQAIQPPAEAGMDLNNQSATPVIGYIGRISPEKGIDRLIDAWLRVSPEQLHLEIAGWPQSEDDTAYYEGMRKKTETINSIRWLGHLDGEAKTRWFYDLAFLCVPSVWLETGPMVVQEAFAHKIPVIGSNLGGIPEWVVDGKNGFLFNPFHLVELEAILRQIDHQPGIRNALLESFPPVHTVMQQARTTLETYKRLLDRQKNTENETGAHSAHSRS